MLLSFQLLEHFNSPFNEPLQPFLVLYNFLLQLHDYSQDNIVCLSHYILYVCGNLYQSH